MKPYIKGKRYFELKDEQYFRTAFANGCTVERANGQDLCPDELYDGSAPMADECIDAAG